MSDYILVEVLMQIQFNVDIGYENRITIIVLIGRVNT